MYSVEIVSQIEFIALSSDLTIDSSVNLLRIENCRFLENRSRTFWRIENFLIFLLMRRRIFEEMK